MQQFRQRFVLFGLHDGRAWRSTFRPLSNNRPYAPGVVNDNSINIDDRITLYNIIRVARSAKQTFRFAKSSDSPAVALGVDRGRQTTRTARRYYGATLLFGDVRIHISPTRPPA